MSIAMRDMGKLIELAKSKQKYQFEVFNVTGYGATGGGEKDDTAAIKKAIGDCDSAGGGIVFFPNGDYRISESLVVPSFVTLLGVGEKSKIFTEVHNLNVIITEYPATDIVIANLKIRGSGYGIQPPNVQNVPDPSGAGCGIVFINVSRGRIENCVIENCGGDGNTSDKNGVAGAWLTYGCSNCRVLNNTVDGCRNGLNEDNFFGIDPVGNWFLGNQISNCRFGIATDCANLARGCRIIDNIIFNCAYGGVDVNKTSYVTVANNRFSGCGNTGQPGVYADACNVYGTMNFQVSDVKVYNNEFSGNYGRAIRVVMNTYYCKVQDNDIRDCQFKDGILIQGSRYATVQNNTISNCFGAGIMYQANTLGSTMIPADQSIVSDNIIHQCGKHGIYMSGAVNTIIANNRISNGGTETTLTYAGILIEKNTQDNSNSENNSITGNIITGGDYLYGIRGADSSTITNLVANNLVIGPLTKISFVSTNQYYNTNGDDRLLNGPVIKAGTSIDVKTNSANIYMPVSNGAVPTGTTGGDFKFDETNKVLYANFGGVWYKTAALTLA